MATEIQLYNTLTHRIETFKPIEPGAVRMYHCGPTVYDFAHIGNFRAFVFADVLRRFFEFTGHRVEQVMNITDVGHMTEDQLADGAGRDKMELAAERLKEAKKQGKAEVENPDDPYQVAAFFTKAFLEDARLLRLKIADPQEERQHMPRATAYVPQMIELIGKLIDQGHAYVGRDGAVYYDVHSFPQYGQLSGNTLEKLHEGAGGRVSEAEQAVKRSPQDFLLWKPDPRHIMKWPSPWGEGYPGWHIECSAMAMSVLRRPTIDIHTGGEDNIFPHHECEIAQSTGATNQPFANYWLHVRFLLVEGQKMSKSKGNFYTVRDLLARGVDPAVLRFELLKTHYRANMNFTTKGLEDSAKAVQRLRDFYAAGGGDAVPDHSDIDDDPTLLRFRNELGSDLNMSGALGSIFAWIKNRPDPDAEDAAVLRRIDQVLGVLVHEVRVRDTLNVTIAEGVGIVPQMHGTGTGSVVPSDAHLDDICRNIAEARARRDFATSDRLRDELTAAGIEVQITKEGVKWRRKVSL